MGLSDERLQILRMLKEDKISVEQANQLLEALESNEVRTLVDDNRRFVVRVTEHGKIRANVNIPVNLARLVAKVIPQDVLDKHHIDLSTILNNLEAGKKGLLVEIDEPEESRRTEILVE